MVLSSGSSVTRTGGTSRSMMSPSTPPLSTSSPPTCCRVSQSRAKLMCPMSALGPKVDILTRKLTTDPPLARPDGGAPGGVQPDLHLSRGPGLQQRLVRHALRHDDLSGGHWLVIMTLMSPLKLTVPVKLVCRRTDCSMSQAGTTCCVSGVRLS